MDSAQGSISKDLTTKNVFTRFIIYTLVIFAMTASLPLTIQYGDITVFSENGPVEWLQVALLLFSAFLLLFDSRIEQCNFKELFFVFAFLQLSAVTRELDAILDKIIPVLGWKLIVAILIAVIVVKCRNKKEILYLQIKRFIRTRAFALLWCGFIVAIPYSQLVGHGDFLKVLMGDDYVQMYKRVIEELGELLGYLFILIGSLEAVLQQKEEQKANENRID